MHHPFTSPMNEDMYSDASLNLSDPELFTVHRSLFTDIKAKAYDIVLNGHETGGRKHPDSQCRTFRKKMFDVLNISEEEAKMKFGFLLDAI